MSNCIKDLFDYDLVKKCCRCENILLKSNFYKKLSSKDGLDSRSIFCLKKYYLVNRDRLNTYQKKYNYENK